MPVKPKLDKKFEAKTPRDKKLPYKVKKPKGHIKNLKTN
jgi:hypothetical protein